MKNINKNIEDIFVTYLKTLHPIIYINSDDFLAVDDMLNNTCFDYKIIEFNNGFGIIDFSNKSYSQSSSLYKCDLFKFMEDNWDNGFERPTILLLKDINHLFNDSKIISILKRISETKIKNTNYCMTVVIVSGKKSIPEELNDFITVLEIPALTTKEIEIVISDFFDTNGVDKVNVNILRLVEFLKGLSKHQITRILSVILYDQIFTDEQLCQQYILSEKEQSVKKSGLLELVKVHEKFEDIGGLKELKRWLKQKNKIINDLDSAIKAGLDKPKGIMITGIPGCGKSLSAKVTASIFHMPLLRFDIGKVLGKYVGESEENMHSALKLAEAMSPCVLWIDEIEKAFTGIGGSDGGNAVTTRIFGQFLTWMQENKSQVFIFATANDISGIPIEFLRKGRFDEVFFVDLPNDKERKKILKIQFKKRINESMDIDLKELLTEEVLEQTKGFISSELETVVKTFFELAYLKDKDLEEKLLLKVIKDLNPISKSHKKEFKAIREKYIEMDLKNASEERFAELDDYEEDEDED